MKEKIRYFMLLHIMLFIYSLSGVCSKLASQHQFLSIEFCLYYSGILILLAMYAVVWQQIIKKIPLTVAFANKAITIIWSFVWSVILFDDKITINKIVGMLLVISGIVLFVMSDKECDQCDS